MADEKDDTTTTGGDAEGREHGGTDDRTTRRPDDDRHGDDQDGGEGDAGQLGDAGKRALDAMRRERNATRKQLAETQAQLRQHTDAQKTDSERLQEAERSATGRADKAETSLRAMQVALDRAPEGATIAQVRAVAKRVRGDDDDALEADADELYTLLAPAKPERQTTVPTGRPTERLHGGASPEDDLEETDPAKLAALIKNN